MVVLNAEEKKKMCIMFAEHLPKLRELLSLSQKSFGERCGISTPRLSVIENGHHVMSWTQFLSILYVCTANKRTREYFSANNIFDVKLFQYLQMKDENIFPETNVYVENIMLNPYIKSFRKNTYNLEPKNKKEIDETYIKNERLTILDKTSHDILFEYLPKTDIFRYSYHDGNGKLIRKEIVGYVKNKAYENTISPEFVEIFMQKFESSLQKPKHDNFEYMTRLGDENYEWRNVSFQSVADDNGVITSLFGHLENINRIILERNNAIELASIDMLTGVYNKTVFQKKASEKLVINSKQSCAMLMIDLDDFKFINDNKGHLFGDEVLKNIAKFLTMVFCVNDVIGRFGGDEFVVFAQNISVDSLKSKIKQFRKLIFAYNNSSVSCSIGCCICKNSIIDINYLIKTADELMYEVKKNGKDNCFLKTIE